MRLGVLCLTALLVLSLSFERGTSAVSAQASTDSQAIQLAQQVLAGGDGALPALETALGQAGIAVLDAGGSPLTPVATPSQGLAFADWEVQSLLGAEASGLRQPLDGAGLALAAADPLLHDQPLGA